MRRSAKLVPAASIQNAIRAYMAGYLDTRQSGNPWEQDFGPAPVTNLALRIWPAMNQKTGTRRLAMLLTQENISFDLADRILCVLDRVDMWWSDPVLAEHYPNVNLEPYYKKHVPSRVLHSPSSHVSVRPESDAT